MTLGGVRMSLYSQHVLPRLIRNSCSVKPVAKQREKIVPRCSGTVLEIGAGGGFNLPFMQAPDIDRVFGLDPNAPLLGDAEARAGELGIEFRPVLSGAEAIPLDRGEVDTVLVTYTLCSIDGLDRALAEMRRVLKPEGRLLFCEHGAAPDPGIRRVQNLLTPVWRRLGGGCRLNRDMPARIRDAGFAIAEQDQMYLPGTWRPLGFNWWGVAVPA